MNSFCSIAIYKHFTFWYPATFYYEILIAANIFVLIIASNYINEFRNKATKVVNRPIVVLLI